MPGSFAELYRDQVKMVFLPLKKFHFNVLWVALLVLAAPADAFGEMKTLVREYTYEASELDSKVTCRAIALERVKQQLLEEMGAYVESSTVVKDSQIDRDEVKVMTAGVVYTTVLDEKWDGKAYWIRARVSADPADVAASIEKMRKDEQLVRELEEARLEAAQAMEEVQALKDQLAYTSTDVKGLQEQYAEAAGQISASDWFEKGSAYTQSGNYEEAVRAYDQVLLLRPDDSKAYINRSIVYINMGNYSQAAGDLNQATVLSPGYTAYYVSRVARWKTLHESRRNFYQDSRAAGDPLQKAINQRWAEVKRQRFMSAEQRAAARQHFQPVQQKDERSAPVGNPAVSRREREQIRKARIEELRKKAERDRLLRRQRKGSTREPGRTKLDLG